MIIHSPAHDRKIIALKLEDIFPKAQPIELELGCGRPHYILEKAQAHPEINFLGIEYKAPFVKYAKAKGAQLGFSNLHMVCENAKEALAVLIPDNCIQQITIQFPDPWFKRRHFKRRLLDENFCQVLAQKLLPQGQIFLQTDVSDLFNLYSQTLENCPLLVNHSGPKGELLENPHQIRSHREKKCLDKGMKIYRIIMLKRVKSVL